MPGRPFAVAVPTWLADVQPSASKPAWLHLALAFGLPTRPGGRWSATLLGLDANVALMVTSAGAPAWRVEVLTESAACAAGVIRKKAAKTAKRRVHASLRAHFRRNSNIGLIVAEDGAQRTAHFADAGLVLERLANHRQQVVAALRRVLEFLQALVGQFLVAVRL